MDITSFLRDNNLSTPLFVLSTILFLLLIVKITRPSSSKNLPPGPPRLPIIGNLHQVGDRPHVSTAKFAKQYGPLISLRLGKQFLVVASSPEAAMEILKTQDRFLSSRVVPTAFQQTSLIPHSLIWSECNQTWKNLRTLCRTEMFSSKALESQSRLRHEKLGQLLDFLHRKQGQVINVEDVVFTTLFNTLSSVIFATDFLDLKDEQGTRDGLKESLHKIIEYGGLIKDFGSFFPMFERFDLQGIRKGTMTQYKKTFAYWEDIIEERRARINSSTWSSDQAESFVDRMLENGFSNDQINQLVTELFVAGTNTTTTSVVWAMTELVRHKEVMSKIMEEIKREITSDTITDSQLSKLPYLQASIKEAMRLHPPVPLLLPHMAAETCEVMNYTIPKNSKIFVNLWAMGRDPKLWDDPLSFNPERFIGSKVDFKGQDFELLPFGSGRRMCPGMPSGVKSVQLILASLIRERLTVFINDQARFTLLSRDSQIPHDSADFVEFVWSDSSDSGLTCEAIQAIQAILWRFSKATTFGGSNIDPTAWEEKNCKGESTFPA
ncbi:probable (S)-N-methylcoclaurine 3'-hydroxylase isozyme 2 [Cynara cardunculus var. scolymus]|uniref:probable (S)-N-methylcoclaurine 3'-hydroxylase isozyme 2 n=1 Tax=Cynara cardunculus var. scolymus TaxID=59895 RepID=UPI000D62BA0F|nr:probable (S)-N-methylcoclaurine 3'-hydroxylase isozyme 2 [Cynara cardunculus var. scolymus]